MEIREPGTSTGSDRQQERFRLLVQSSPDIITVLDSQGTILYQSPSIERVLGYRPEERIGRNLLDSPLLHPDDKGSVQLFIARLLQSPDTDATGEFRLRHADGTYRWIEAVGRNLPGEPGVGSIIASMRDITEWKHSQEELAERTWLADLGAQVAEAITQCGDLRTMLQRCVEVLVHHLDAAFARIWTLDEGWGVLVLQASAGMYTHIDDAHSRIPVGMYKIGLIAQQRQPHLTNSVLQDRGISDPEWARREGMVAFAGHPLIVEERLVGVMALFARRPLQESTLTALESVADRIALGIDRKRVEEELHRSLDSLLVLHESGRMLGSSLELDELGPRLLEIAQRVVGVSAAVLSFRGDDGELSVGYAAGPEELWRRARDTAAAAAAYRRALERGEPEGFRLDLPEAVPLRVAAWCLPLVAHDETIGMLEAYGPPSLEDEQTVEMLVSLAHQAAGALENARLYEALAERERRLEQLVGKLLSAQEEERRRVAYEVHDGLAQTAAAAHQHLQAYAHSHKPGSRQAQEELGAILELVRRTVGDARRVIADLRPTELDDFGLAAAIRLQLDALRPLGWHAHLEENLGGERLPPMLETALLRVAQEALRNARKHSGTDRVHVKLERAATSVRLEVRDWGRGFEPHQVAVGSGPGERVGLAGMSERMRLLGSELRISSAPGEGTSVVAQVPVAQEGGLDG